MAAKRECCVVDVKGKTIACYPTEKEARVLQRIVSRSKVLVACKVPRRRRKRR
jgi:hypothetical protein